MASSLRRGVLRKQRAWSCNGGRDQPNVDSRDWEELAPPKQQILKGILGKGGRRCGNIGAKGAAGENHGRGGKSLGTGGRDASVSPERGKFL